MNSHALEARSHLKLARIAPSPQQGLLDEVVSHCDRAAKRNRKRGKPGISAMRSSLKLRGLIGRALRLGSFGGFEAIQHFKEFVGNGGSNKIFIMRFQRPPDCFLRPSIKTATSADARLRPGILRHNGPPAFALVWPV